MFNNAVTYNEQWNTPENKKARAKLMAKYLIHSHAPSDCPVAWAPEVLEYFDRLEQEFGIERKLPKASSLWSAVNLPSILIDAFLVSVRQAGGYNKEKKKYIYKWNLLRLYRLPKNVFEQITKRVRDIYSFVTGGTYNYLRRPRIKILQFKEKYGEVTFYHSSHDEYVDTLLMGTAIKLSRKGAYYSMEELLNRTRTEYINKRQATIVEKEDYYSKTTHPYRELAQSLLEPSEFQAELLKLANKDASEQEKENAKNIQS